MRLFTLDYYEVIVDEAESMTLLQWNSSAIKTIHFCKFSMGKQSDTELC